MTQILTVIRQEAPSGPTKTSVPSIGQSPGAEFPEVGGDGKVVEPAGQVLLPPTVVDAEAIDLDPETEGKTGDTPVVLHR